MARLRSLIEGLRSLFHKSQADAGLDEELRAYLDAAVAEKIKHGMSPAEARRAARLEMGGTDAVKEEVHSVGWEHIFETFWQDLRFAVRMLRKSPGFTTVAVLTLALGIGANTAIFSAVYGILLKPLAYPHSERLFTIYAGLPKYTEPSDLSLPDFRDIASFKQAFEQAGAAEASEQWLTGYGAPAVLNAQRVTGDFFSTFGQRPVLGRPILPADIGEGQGQVAVLSYGLWRERFGGNRSVLGQRITMTNFLGRKAAPESYAIIGVMPPGFGSSIFGPYADQTVWIPLVPSADEKVDRLFSDKFAVVRAMKDFNANNINAELLSLSARLAKEYPESNRNRIFWAEPLQDVVAENSRTGLLVLWVAVSFLLLIACVNLGSLGLARVWGRRREVAIRSALGATRFRVVRQFLTESSLLAVAGGAAGVGLAFCAVKLFRALAPGGTPRLDQVGLDATVLAYALGVSLLSGILSAIVPAMQISARNPGGTLKEMGTFSLPSLDARHPRRLRNGLVISEVALCLILVIASALTIRSFDKLTHVSLGFRTDHILSQFLNISPGLCKRGQRCVAFDDILSRVRRLPGVTSAALSSGRLLSGGLIQDEFIIQGRAVPQTEEDTPVAEELDVSPEYFRTMGISVLRGRSFSDGDVKGAPGVAVVNEELARRYFGGRPLGHRISEGSDGHGHTIWAEIVGIVNDSRDISPSRPPRAELYFPFDQAHSFPSGTLFVRTAADPESLASGIREQVWAVDKNAPVTHVQTLDHVLSQAFSEPRFRAVLLGTFGSLGLLLALVGIYGVISSAVAQRTHEIGVRMAFGAQSADVLRMVIGEGAVLAAVGIAAGIGGAFGLTRFLRSLLFEVSPTDPVTFAGVALALLLVALAACYIPARRAMRVDPMVALRHE